MATSDKEKREAQEEVEEVSKSEPLGAMVGMHDLAVGADVGTDKLPVPDEDNAEAVEEVTPIDSTDPIPY